MRTSTIAVSSAFLLAGLSAAFPVEGGRNLVARFADSDFTGIEARAYDDEHAWLTRRRDPPLPPGFPYGNQADYARHLDRWDTRRQHQNNQLQDSPRQSQPPTPITPDHSGSLKSPHSRLTRRRDPPLPPGFPSGDWVRHLDVWDTRREHQNRPPSRSSPPPSHSTSPPRSPSPHYRRAFYDLD